MDTIQGMRTFAAVAAQQSFTAGAKRLGISTKLASKYVAQLEERLNAQLFHRTTRSVTLTDTGRAYFERCLPLLDQFDELEGIVQQRQTDLAGPIRITAPTGFGSTHLVRMLHPFQEKHAKVTIDLHLSDHHVPLVEEGFDLALRFGKLSDSSVVERKLADMRITSVASPQYLAKNGHPAHPDELAGHNCLVQTIGATPDLWRFKGPEGPFTVSVRGSFRANSPPAVANMAVDGLGIGRVPHYTARPFLDAGQLVALFEGFEDDPVGLYAVYPPGRHLTERIRQLIDHLSREV